MSLHPVFGAILLVGVVLIGDVLGRLMMRQSLGWEVVLLDVVVFFGG